MMTCLFNALPSHLRPVTMVKPVSRIFDISDSNRTRGKCGKYGSSLAPQEKQGFRVARLQNEVGTK